MQLWRNDLCGCLSSYELVDNNVTGQLIEPCIHHTTFEQSIADNRRKNYVINTISESVELNDVKYITYEFNESHQLVFTAHGFDEIESDIFDIVIAS